MGMSYQKAFLMILFIPSLLKSLNLLWWSEYRYLYLLYIGSRHRDWFRTVTGRQRGEDSEEDQKYPKDAEAKHVKHEYKTPANCAGYLACPEESFIDNVGLDWYIRILEAPAFLTIFIHFAPPSQSNQQSTCDILDRPEIKSTQDDDKDEGEDARINDFPNDQIKEEGCCFEDEGGDTGTRMCSLFEIIVACTLSNLLLFLVRYGCLFAEFGRIVASWLVEVYLDVGHLLGNPFF